MSEGSLAGRHAFVTGGGSGIGAAIARTLASRGATVTIAGRTAAALESVAQGQAGLRTEVADVTQPDTLRDAMARADAEQPLDVIVANAGAAEARPLPRIDEAHWRAMLDVNLGGVLHTFQHGAATIDGRPHGRLIAIASTAGLKGYAYTAAYSAAKHGVVGLVRSLSLELARKPVTVNAVCPGFTETPLLTRSVDAIVHTTHRDVAGARNALRAGNPQGRFVQPDEVASAVAWLAGRDTDAVNGQAIKVSGGE